MTHAIRSLQGFEATQVSATDLEAVFLPRHGMLGASLRHRGEELLRRVDQLPNAAARGSTAGIPLLHPWANRLSDASYRAAGEAVTLDLESRFLHLDGNGLPIHGVPWSLLAWRVTRHTPTALDAELEWSSEDVLGVFPFPHRLTMSAAIEPGALTITTTLVAGQHAVPVSFGFHPYFGLPSIPRSEWRLRLPQMRAIELDAFNIPTGRETPYEGFDGPLASIAFDHGFRLDGTASTLSLAGGGRIIHVDLLAGYGFAQVFAPTNDPCVALEPMTAPTNALVTGRGLRLVQPGGEFTATFRIRVEDDPASASHGPRLVR
ncbi:MAG: aldose 1-epimerase [Phycisphaerales bacterium]